MLSALTRTREGRVVALALASRIAVLTLMALCDAAFRDLASSAQLQNFPCDGTRESVDPNFPVHSTSLDEFAPWDSVYFVRIAKCGYENDMIHAFFPLLPWVMRYGEKLTGLFLLEPWVPIESLYTLLGIIVNVVAFCVAALALYKLTLATIPDADVAYLSVIFFCFNPASVFYSALYTEALFAACTWVGLLLLPSHFWAGVAALTAASAARSNGTLACWFILHHFASKTIQTRKISLSEAIKTILGCGSLFAPYIAMQLAAYRVYCGPSSSLIGELRQSWCSNRIPSVYGFVQAKYWDVGFLSFYSELERWPRVIQSVPVVFLAIAACWTWASADWHRAFTLSLLPPTKPSCKYPSRIKTNKSGSGAETSHRSSATTAAFNSAAVGPYIYHLALMTAAVVLMMHVNVATRFLSVNPVLYWYTAVYLQKGGWWRAGWVWLWALAFTALGSLMFPNFYPWT